MTSKQVKEEESKLNKMGDNNSEEEYEYVTTPPDGEYGWVVAFAAMVISFFFNTFHL